VSVLVRLTERERQVDDTVRAVIRHIEDNWAEQLGQDNYTQLMRLLRTLFALLGE
jgi:hypothetical protein